MEKQHKITPTINPAITENAVCSIIKVHAPVTKEGVSLDHGVSLNYASFPAMWGSIPCKE